MRDPWFGNGGGRALIARQLGRRGHRARALQHRDDAQLVIGVADGHSGLRQPMWRFDPAIRLVGRRDVVGEAIQPQLHDVCACSSKTRGGIAAVLAGKEAP